MILHFVYFSKDHLHYGDDDDDENKAGCIIDTLNVVGTSPIVSFMFVVIE